MPKIYLVRHGEAEQQWGGVNPDPGLSVLGVEQAANCADWFRGQAPLKVLHSPRSRAQQTASPLLAHWSVQAEMALAFDEIPTLADIDDRRQWLLGVLGSNWPELPELIQLWRQQIIQHLLSITEPTVIFTHFMVINSVVAEVLDDPRCCVFQPSCCSVTQLSLDDGQLSLIELGDEAQTLVN